MLVKATVSGDWFIISLPKIVSVETGVLIFVSFCLLIFIIRSFEYS